MIHATAWRNLGKCAKWKKPGTKKKKPPMMCDSFTWKVQNGQINKDRKIGDFLGPGGISNWRAWAFFWRWWKKWVLKIVGSMVAQLMNILKTLNCTFFNRVGIVAYKLYLNAAIKQTSKPNRPSQSQWENQWDNRKHLIQLPPPHPHDTERDIVQRRRSSLVPRVHQQQSWTACSCQPALSGSCCAWSYSPCFPTPRNTSPKQNS